MPPLAELGGHVLGGLGRPYVYVESCPSTQDLLRDAAFPHGAVAVTEHQTAGRGRMGRLWEDAAGEALLCSVLLRPASGSPVPQLSLVVALAATQAVEAVAGLPALVKWPNDVLVDDRKVAGILLEGHAGRVIAGVGLNVNQTEAQLPADTLVRAGSLWLATGRAHDRGELLLALLERLETAYGAWQANGLSSLLPELEERNALRGRRVDVGGAVGTAGVIAGDGRLQIDLDDGRATLVGSGEVELGAAAE